MMEGRQMPGSIQREIQARLEHLYPFALAAAKAADNEKEPAEIRAWDLARAWLQREIDAAQEQVRLRLVDPWRSRR